MTTHPKHFEHRRQERLDLGEAPVLLERELRLDDAERTLRQRGAVDP